jgi:hypothetical protein
MPGKAGVPSGAVSGSPASLPHAAAGTATYTETVSLAGGACLLKRPYRASGASTARDTAVERREPARVITMAWGERYIDDLIEITIPALLAPGNLPAFAAEFDCELVIVTETRLFDRVVRSATIAALLDFVDLRLVPIDDLLSPWYGITLTYALVRGFADLGPSMTRTHLVFLNADFILADGSYRKLAKMIKHGERLVVSPSYCMNLENTVDSLRRRRDPTSGALSLPPRELARIIIDNRHNTIRAKTVNQRMFRIHRYDQFYWYVDDNTLLSRQLPIAVVYMRPERVLTEMPTFWDYGVISEYCPTTTPCVLADSDDFLMAELRNVGTFRELLHLGWPTIDEIASDLSSFTTQDHRDYGRHTLVLHAGELPPGIDAEKAELAAFVDQVYARLKPPIDYRDHPFWAPQFPQFIARQRHAFRELRAEEAALADMVKSDTRAMWRQRQIESLSARLSAVEREVCAAQQRLSQKHRSTKTKRDALAEEFCQRRMAIEVAAQSLAADETATIERLGGEVVKFETRLSKLRQQQRRALHRFTGSKRHVPIPSSEEMLRDLDREDDAAIRRTWRVYRAKAAKAGIAWCAQVYRSAFGSLPRTTRFHPYHTMLQPTLGALSARGATRVLVISSGGSLTAVLAAELTGEKLTITPALLDSELWRTSLRNRPKFNLCLCDLAADDLVKFCKMLEWIRPLLTEPGRIVMVHHPFGQAIDQRTYDFTAGLFPLVGRSQIAFAGSYPGALSVRWFTRALQRHNVGVPAGIFSLAAILAVCAPLARLGCWVEQRRKAQVLPVRCTSMTIAIDLP